MYKELRIEMTPQKIKKIDKEFPNKIGAKINGESMFSNLELLFLTVFALPNASRTGLDYQREKDHSKLIQIYLV